ncbi:hypothetical protein RO3G_13522 [Lichtheimia corymbifera JMRC:FSU:9682]|uniref:Uncharacterized protein n=1 Tax=Lichtheimia corymbifera JMRC:FSU:9682 TaxID=1263082 RepID=A0A068RTG0_9FUNG|nr:hypothetical protein RO3G_13522 [Lichtheimia corymbifera JMRC:FSU:9682]
MDKTEVVHHDDLKHIYQHSDSNDSSTSYSRTTTTHPPSLRKERSLSNDTAPTLNHHHHPDVSMSRQSSSTTISDGRETSHTIIVSSEQTDDDEKHWAPAATKATDHDNGRIRTHPMAWIALFFLVVLRSAVSIFQNTFSPIPTVVADYLGVSLTEVNWLFNIQAVLILAGLITAAGCWVRWVAVLIHPPSFPVMMLGQVIASVGSPLTLNIMTKFAAVWFPENRRATAGMFVASNYGGMIAMFLMPAVATGKDKIEMTIIMVAGICTGATIPQFLLPAKPPVPVSYEPQQKAGTTSPPSKALFLQSTIALMKSVHFWILCGIHGINVGLSIAWGALLNQAITPYGYSDSQAGNMVAVAMAAGAVGAFKQDSFAAIMYVNALNNFFLSFMVPTVVELGVEVSHPIPESISTSILWQMAQLVGFILVLVLDVFRDPNGDPPNNMFRGLVFQAAMAGVSVVLSLIYNGPMLRTEAIKEREEQRALESN